MTTTKDVIQDDKLTAIEFYDDNGEFRFQAMWDSRDEHTPENVAAFRVWAAKMAIRLDNKTGV